MSFVDLNRLPEFLVEKIFSHLDFNDILHTLMVSRSWHNTIGINPYCMNKLRLRIEGWHDLEIIQTIMKQNGRNYTSIRLHNINPNKDISYLKTQNWKDVCIEQMKFTSQNDFYEYLVQFGDNIEVLEIEKIIVLKEEQLKNTLNLPRLRRMALKKVPTSAFSIFTRCPLKSLEFDIPAFGTNRRSLIIDFFEHFLYTPLESLVICRNSLYGLSSDDISSVEKTIISMADSLKVLKLKDWGCCHSFERLWSYLKVELFSINFCSQQPRIRDIQLLTPNMDLKKLELSHLRMLSVEWCRLLFILTPSLEHLFMTKIRKEIVHHAASLLQRLKFFEYVSCTIDIRKTEMSASDDDRVEIIELDQESLGDEYDYIGSDEVFDLQGNMPLPLVIERHSDNTQGKSFAKIYYSNIKHLPGINKQIEILKVVRGV